MTEHKLAHILRAIADGRTVQIRARSTGGFWVDFDTSDAFSIFVTNPNIEYRIKPKPLVKKWILVVKEKATGKILLTGLHYSSEEEYNHLRTQYVALQRVESTMIEVEED